MKKNMIQSTLLLIFISTFSKMLSFFVRILLARNLSNDAMNYYTLAAPTMIFVISLAQMGIPSALAKVISQKDHYTNELKSAILLCIINNIVVSFSFALIIPFLAKIILKQNIIQPILYSILPLLPLVTLSGILKGYLYGIQKHLQAASSQFFEELSRVLFLIAVFTFLPVLNPIQMASIAMLSISIGELCSAMYMFLCTKIKKRTLFSLPFMFKHLSKNSFYEILNVSLPMTGSRLIGSITYFLEPIFMVYGLSILDASKMIDMYGLINGYVLPIITMPSFITITLSNFLLPSFTYHYTRGKYEHAQRLSSIIILCCFFVGCTSSFICYKYSKQLLILFYHNERGALLLKQLSLPFALYALQPPLTSMLHALSKSKQAVIDTFLGSFIRILLIIILTPSLKESSLMIALTIGMLVTTLIHGLRVCFAFKPH